MVRLRRLRPDEHPGIDLRRSDPRVVWATSAQASSKWSASYAARDACGPPNIYPRGGDLTPSWLAANDDRHPWIELTFPETDTVHAVIVCETCGAGAVTLIRDIDGDEALFALPPQAIPESRKARLLVVELEPRKAPRRLRLELAPYDFGSEYHEIDAVGLVRVPFEELAQPYVPPPPPPTPEELLTRLEGTLRGVSPEAPVAFVRLRRGRKVRAWCTGGPARLHLDAGAEITLEVGRTAIYGAPLIRARGPWAELVREHPILGLAPSAATPGATDDVTVELRTLDRERRVEVAGEPGERTEGGFRDGASGPPRTIVARAISVGPLAASAFATEGLAGFDQMTDRETPVGSPHPLARWERGLGIASLASLATFAVALGVLGPADGYVAVVGTPAVFLTLHALEILGRRRAIAQLAALPHTGHHDRRPAFSSVGWTLTTSGLGFVLGMPLIALSILASHHPASGLLTMLAGCGALALVRLCLWQRVQGSTLLAVARAVCAGESRRAGHRAALTGFLGPGEHRREEDYAQRVEHTGTESRTDARGHVTTHDTFRWWYERRLSARGPREVTLHLRDGASVRCEGAVHATDVSMVHAPTSEGITNLVYARFRGAHDEGDEASLIGVVQSVSTEEIVLRDSLLVLGSLAVLRRRVAIQLAAVAGLLAITALGAACAVLLLA